jgi:LPS-assembly lipoprotein
MALTRRAGLLAGLAALPAVLMGGCGFQLRRPPELQLKRIHLRGFDRHSGQADELRRQLRFSPGVVLAEAASEADLVLEVLLDVQTRVATTTTAAGQIRDLALRTRLRYRVVTPTGLELIAPTELAQSRDMTYQESAALAKEDEAKLLLRAMYADTATQVLRRLAAIGPATVAAAASAASAASAAAAAQAASVPSILVPPGAPSALPRP